LEEGQAQLTPFPAPVQQVSPSKEIVTSLEGLI